MEKAVRLAYPATSLYLRARNQHLTYLAPIAFFDLETSMDEMEILDAGAFTSDGRLFHHSSASKLVEFLYPYGIIAGHNIVNHDLKALRIRRKKWYHSAVPI